MAKNLEPVVSSVPTPPSSLVEVDKVRIWSHGRSLDTIGVGADFLSVPRKIKPRMIGFPFTPQLSIVTRRGSEHQSTKAPDHQADMLGRKHNSASITSSVLDYEFENGRRYHAYKAGSYPLPNDEVRPTNSPCSAPQCRMVFSGSTPSGEHIPAA